MDILRFITAGSVDDGKSTLIGRLLYDSKSILIDQLEALEKQSKNNEIDLALLTDGLRAEREQGITIDVAYKYFSTTKRKFIIADAPGHIQYTRNMVTGASNSDLAIILIDARNGISEQTRRHSIIASLLKIPFIVVAINKMDLINYDKIQYDKIVAEYKNIAQKLGLTNIYFIPMSALSGENIIHHSANMKWYDGKVLLEYLENVEIKKTQTFNESRFIVQYVIRPQSAEYHDYRGFAGKILSGNFHVGQEVMIPNNQQKSKISKIEIATQAVSQAQSGQSVVLHLADNVDISRGNLIVQEKNTLQSSNEVEAIICWMDEKLLTVGNKYFIQINSYKERVIVKEIMYKINVSTLAHQENIEQVGLNDIVRIKFKTAASLYFDTYATFRTTGGAILIDETSHLTVAALMLE